jgi:hypothetical protein
MGTLKVVGRVYRPIFIEGFAKLHECKTPIMAADL